MRSLLLLWLLTTLAAPAAMRNWRNTTGTKSFKAEFLTSDGARVTLKRVDGRIITISVAKLHENDRAWVRNNVAPKDLAADAPPPKGAAFDQLEFGDDRNTVEAKLQASKLVSAALDETLFGRTGLNGVFKTTRTIGGLHCYLFFDWSKAGGLREVTLQTQPVSKGRYITSLRGNWAELIDLLNKLHGRPVQAAGFPDADELQDGAILGSHLWYTEEGHSVILGTGQEGRGYNVVVRITSELIRPVPIGASPVPDENNVGGPPKASDFQP
ncbi:MAG: SHD1 domain-containing protein [Roseibacillus sp.]|jgi:hypothetical protein